MILLQCLFVRTLTNMHMCYGSEITDQMRCICTVHDGHAWMARATGGPPSALQGNTDEHTEKCAQEKTEKKACVVYILPDKLSNICASQEL